jgi:hypothetical protein
MSTYEKEMQITEAVQDQAEADAPRSGYDTTPYYTVPIDPDTGHVKTVNASNIQIGAGQTGNAVNATTIEATPVKDGYQNYHEDAETPNGAPFTSGITFPGGPVEGQFCLRTDYHPKRLFRYDGRRWVKYEDNVRMTMSQNDTASGNPRLNQKGSFINNPTVSTINGKQVEEKQSLSKVLKPKADN